MLLILQHYVIFLTLIAAALISHKYCRPLRNVQWSSLDEADITGIPLQVHWNILPEKPLIHRTCTAVSDLKQMIKEEHTFPPEEAVLSLGSHVGCAAGGLQGNRKIRRQCTDTDCILRHMLNLEVLQLLY